MSDADLDTSMIESNTPTSGEVANKRKLLSLGAMIVLLVVGVMGVNTISKYILGIQANLTSQAIEAELAQLLPPGVITGSDQNASNGGYIEFTNVATPTPTSPPTGSGISFVSSTYATSSKPQRDLTISIPSGVREGDVLVALMQSDYAGQGVQTLSGWRLINPDPTPTPPYNVYDLSARAYWKVATANEPTSYTWTLGPNADAVRMIIGGTMAVFRGVNTTDPVAAWDVNYETSGSGRQECPTVNSPAGGMYICLFAHDDPVNYGVPSNMTSIAEWQFPNPGCCDDTHLSVYELRLNAGQTGTRLSTFPDPKPNGGNDHTVGFVLRPANTGPIATNTPTPFSSPTPIGPTNTPRPTSTPGPTLPPSACNKFVATNGNDTNPGTFDRPWKNVTDSVNKLSDANGWTLCIRSGTYTDEAVKINRRGSEGKPITVMKYPADPTKPVFTKKFTIGSWGSYTSAAYIHISGIESAGVNDYAVEHHGEYNKLDDWYIHDAAQAGILIRDSRYSEFYRLRVMNNVKAWGCQGSGGWPSAFSVKLADHITAKYNEVGGNCGEGMNAWDGSSFITFANNIVYDNWSVEMYMDHTNNSTFENNLIYSTRTGSGKIHAHGISIANETRVASCDLNNLVVRNNFVINTKVGINHPAYNCGANNINDSIIENNTLVNNTEAGIKLASAGTGNVVRNNIIQNRPGEGKTVEVPNTSGHSFLNNMVFGGSSITWGGSGNLSCLAWIGLPGLASNLCAVSNPLLDSAGGYSAEANKLRPGSPAGVAGIVSGATRDYFDTLRSAPYSIGAHEL